MDNRSEILGAKGFEIVYEEREKYRGGGQAILCKASKGGTDYFAFTVADLDHYQRLVRIQDSIPHMARLLGPFEDVILIEKAPGRLLWDWDDLAPHIPCIQDQLIDFATATGANGLIHGDLRPWNVFYDPQAGVRVIDWWKLSCFIDKLHLRGDLVEGHYARFFRGMQPDKYDYEDACRIGRLLRREIGIREAWAGQYQPPRWCNP